MLLQRKYIQTLFIFLFFIFYNTIFDYLFDFIGMSNSILKTFLSDLLIFGIILIIYRSVMKNNWTEFKNNFSLKSTLKIIKVLFIMVVCNIAISFLSYFVLGDEINEINAIQSLVNQSIPYLIFKSLFFSSIVETLVFQYSIKQIINNKIIYVIISSLLFMLMNLMYLDFYSSYLLFDLLSYFIMASVFALTYIKTDNIYFIILIKLLYNIIPLIANIMMLGEI